MRLWYWLWDDWFWVNKGWIAPVIAAGILVGTFIANTRFERRVRRRSGADRVH